MSCSSCGQSLGTNPTCTSCCSNSNYPTPQPYYSCTESCEEDHTKQVLVPQFVAVVNVNNGWNVPECGETATLIVKHLSQILVNSYLWNATFGYFKIVGFNADVNQVTVLNQCNSANAEPGTAVPACSSFIVTPTPGEGLSGQASLYPYVAVDFTAPNEGSPILITVTTVNGLAVGKNAQIGSGVYQIESIPGATTIEILNNGAGITPGTPVIALNSAGEYQYPIILIDANQCTNPAVNTGSILVCSNGVTQPLDASTLGSIPVVVDIDDNLVEYKVLELPTRTCSTVLCCLTLTPGQTSYTINVANSAQFEVGDDLQLGSRNDRYEITAIPDSSHIIATRDSDPSAIEDIAPGTSICLVGCCETVGNTVDDILDGFGGTLTPCSNFQTAGLSVNAGSTDGLAFPIHISNSNVSQIRVSDVISITNPSTCRTMHIMVHLQSRCLGAVSNSNTSTAIYRLRVVPVIDGVVQVAGANGITNTVYNRNNNPLDHTMIIDLNFTRQIAPGATVTIQGHASIESLSPAGSSANYQVNLLDCLLSYIGVAA